MAEPQLRKILALLESAAHERQIAAAIVLGEIGARDAAVIDALGAAVARGIAPVQRHALDALGHLASGAGVRWVHLGVLTGEAVAFALFMMFVAPNIVRQLHPRLAKFSTQSSTLVVALAICLFFSWLSVKIGMAAIIGAFFAGLMFADYAPQWNLPPRVGGITAFLAPFFFFDIGSRFNVRLLTGNLLTTALVISLLAVISKLIGCGLPLLREGWTTVFQVGIGMTPRGEVALIVALVGLQSAILSQPAYGVVVLMTIVTTLLAPPILRYLFRDEIRVPVEENASAPIQL